MRRDGTLGNNNRPLLSYPILSYLVLLLLFLALFSILALGFFGFFSDYDSPPPRPICFDRSRSRRPNSSLFPFLFPFLLPFLFFLFSFFSFLLRLRFFPPWIRRRGGGGVEAERMCCFHYYYSITTCDY